ncbi:MAG TPA: hypothetical protein VMV86_01075 [Methanosarcinales archaeon]|nr:hypothetical protein [Methanosarcinales archaeon]
MNKKEKKVEAPVDTGKINNLAVETVKIKNIVKVTKPKVTKPKVTKPKVCKHIFAKRCMLRNVNIKNEVTCRCSKFE